MPAKWEDFTGEGPAGPEQKEPEKKSVGSLHPIITAAIIVAGALIVVAMLLRGGQPAGELAWAWLPEEQVTAPPITYQPPKPEPPKPAPPKPIPRNEQITVRGGNLTYELDVPCAGKPRGQPFKCGSASPTGWCFCRER